MKNFLISVWVVMFTLAGLSQPIPPPPATQTEVNVGTATFPYVSPATLASRIGGYITTNGWPQSDGMPFVLWNEWTELNSTNRWGTNGPTANHNGLYQWHVGANMWSNTSASSFVTNAGTWLGRLTSVGSAIVNTNGYTNLPATNWFSLTPQTNIFWRFEAMTNACWRLQTFGAVTNWTDYSNGMGGIVISNGAIYDVSSRVGATNKSWQLRLAAP